MAADNVQQDASQFTKIYTLSLPAGIKRDGTIFETNEYSDGVWCRFQRGDAKKIGGYRSIFSSPIGIYRGMVSQPYNGVNYIFAGNYETLDVFTNIKSLYKYGEEFAVYDNDAVNGSFIMNATIEDITINYQANKGKNRLYAFSITLRELD